MEIPEASEVVPLNLYQAGTFGTPLYFCRPEMVGVSSAVGNASEALTIVPPLRIVRKTGGVNQHSVETLQPYDWLCACGLLRGQPR